MRARVRRGFAAVYLVRPIDGRLYTLTDIYNAFHFAALEQGMGGA